jgi:hypothetical protein
LRKSLRVRVLLTKLLSDAQLARVKTPVDVYTGGGALIPDD